MTAEFVLRSPRRDEEHDRDRGEASGSPTLQNHALKGLLRTIAHGANNQLSLIINYSKFVAEAVAEAPKDASTEYWKPVQEDIATVTEAGAELALLVARLLECVEAVEA